MRTKFLPGILLFTVTLLGACGKPGEKAIPLDLAILASHLKGVEIQTEEQAYAVLKDVPPAHWPGLENGLKAEWGKLRQSKEVYVWELEDQRVRRPHYCRNECACVADRLGKYLVKHQPGLVVLRIAIHGGDSLGVGAFVGYGRLYTSWSYHVALAVHDRNSGWSFIDPIVFQDSEPRPFAQWYDRFVHKTPMTFYVHPLTAVPDIPREAFLR